MSSDGIIQFKNCFILKTILKRKLRSS